MSPVAAHSSVETAVVSGNVTALLAFANKARGIAARRHTRDLLEQALLCADPGAVNPSQRAEAKRLGVDPSVCVAPELHVPPHAVLVPLVLTPLDVGIVRYLRIGFDASTHGNDRLALDATAARAVSDALQLAATHLSRDAIDRAYCLTTVHPDAFAEYATNVRLRGPSLGAAAFVSAMSLWSEREVIAGTVVTGKLLGKSVREVGGLSAKLRAAVTSRADVQRVIVPRQSLAGARRALRGLGRGAGRAIEVIGVSNVNELIDAALEPSAQTSVPVRQRVAKLRLEFDQGWQSFDWTNVREHAERLVSMVPEQSVDLRVELLSMLGATHDHLGSPQRALELLLQAVQLARGQHWVPDVLLSRLHGRLAMTQRRLFQFSQARRSATQAIHFAKRSRHRDELYKSLGCAGLVELAAGRADKALPPLESSLALTHAQAPDSCIRSHAYLIEAYARAGDGARSEREWNTALEHFAQPAGKQSGSEDAWLRTSRGAALWLLGQTKKAIDVLDVSSVRAAIERSALPGLWARRYLGLSMLAEDAIAEGQTLLAASEVAYGPSLGANLAFGAQLNVLCEAWGLSSRGHWDSDIAGRTRVALERFPDHLRQGALERWRQTALLGVTTGTLPRANTVNALHQLITTTTRIA